jgi:hypothetical protein
MTDPSTGPRRKKAPAARVPAVRPARDTLIIDHESFQAMCRSVLNFSEELANIRRDISDIKLQNYQIGSNQEVTAGDLAAIVSALARIEQGMRQPPQAPNVYRPQYDHQGQPVQQPRQLPPQAPMRDVLRGMQGVEPRQPNPGFMPTEPDNGRR